MLATAPMPTRRPPPELLPERTRPDGPSAQITSVGQAGPASPRLVVTAGPRKGAEFILVEPLTTLGRGRGNAVMVADPAVSRRHSRMEKQGGGWILHDQGSGNGTRVNGRRVERRRLRHGDEIGMGDTRLRFLEPDGVIAWSEAPRAAGPRGRAHLYAATAAALGIVLAAGAVRQARLRQAAEVEARAQAVRAAARSQLQQGIALAKAGKRSEGRDLIAVALELDPGDQEISRALRSAEAEPVPRRFTAERKVAR